MPHVPVYRVSHPCDRPSSQCARYKDSANNEQLLQRLLYWGLQPMIPFNGNDHGITRWQAEHAPKPDIDVFVDYGPLFKALYGRRWVYTAHAVQITNGSAAVNIFHTPKGLVVYTGLATPHSKVVVAVRGVQQNSQLLELISPGQDGAAAKLDASAEDEAMLSISMGSRGTVMAVLVPSTLT